MKLREDPCEQCGWKFPGFHVCVDLRKPIDPAIQRKHNQRYIHENADQRRDRMIHAVGERWRQHREETADRDAKIIQAYRDGMSMKDLSMQFGPAKQTIMGILHRAEVRGEITVRPPGNNNRWQQSTH